MISSGDPVLDWTSFRDTLKKVARSELGLKKWAYQDWFDEDDHDKKGLLAKRNKEFNKWQNDLESSTKKLRFESLQSLVQQKLKTMQDVWWEKQKRCRAMWTQTTPRHSTMLSKWSSVPLKPIYLPYYQQMETI